MSVGKEVGFIASTTRLWLLQMLLHSVRADFKAMAAVAAADGKEPTDSEQQQEFELERSRLLAETGAVRNGAALAGHIAVAAAYCRCLCI